MIFSDFIIIQSGIFSPAILIQLQKSPCSVFVPVKTVKSGLLL